jgi:branched-chain amino acid transport system ATP-binding protein
VVERLLVLDFGKVIGIGAPGDHEPQDVREIYLGIEV